MVFTSASNIILISVFSSLFCISIKITLKVKDKLDDCPYGEFVLDFDRIEILWKDKNK